MTTKYVPTKLKLVRPVPSDVDIAQASFDFFPYFGGGVITGIDMDLIEYRVY